MSKINIIPIFVPHLGCPNDCVFCNQRKISGRSEFDFDSVTDTIEYFLDIFKNSNNDIEIAFYGGSFTAIERETQFKLLEIARDLKIDGKIDRIRLSTRPDAIDEEILTYLEFYMVDIIELGVQSLDKNVLELSKRNHSVESVYKAVDLIKSRGFKLGIQQMIGLPGDSEDLSILTTKKIIDLEPDFVRIYPTLVIKDTELEDMYNLSIYNPLTLDNAVEIVSKLIVLYESSSINIIRVGLQSSDNLKFDKDVVAGPLHDAFRELCESEIFYNIIKINKLDFNNNKVEIISSNRNISILSGQKSVNKERIRDNINAKCIKLKNNSDNENLEIFSNNETYKINILESKRILAESW